MIQLKHRLLTFSLNKLIKFVLTQVHPTTLAACAYPVFCTCLEDALQRPLQKGVGGWASSTVSSPKYINNFKDKSPAWQAIKNTY